MAPVRSENPTPGALYDRERHEKDRETVRKGYIPGVSTPAETKAAMLLDEKREKENARIRKGGHKAQKECRDRNKGTPDYVAATKRSNDASRALADLKASNILDWIAGETRRQADFPHLVTPAEVKELGTVKTDFENKKAKDLKNGRIRKNACIDRKRAAAGKSKPDPKKFPRQDE